MPEYQSISSAVEADGPVWRQERLLRSSEVAALFDVSRRTVGDWARAGMLDALITPGGHRRFRAGQVDALLERSRRV